MNQRSHLIPMLAQGAGSASSAVSAGTAREPRPALAPEDGPDAAAEAVLALLSKERFHVARRLAAEAAARFPEHPRVQGVWAIFDTRGKARVGSGGPAPSRREEFAWLRNPPDWARGKWVALVGGEAVAAADSLEEVSESLESKTFDRTPLVHRVD